MERLPVSAFGISGDGKTVVGFVDNGDPNLPQSKRVPCFWTRSTGVRRLSLGTYHGGEAEGSSADGSTIVGTADGDIVVWTYGKGPRKICRQRSPWEMSYSFPAISADGKWVVGATNGSPFKWSSATGLMYLDPLDPAHPSGFACGVSADGSTVVGASSRGPDRHYMRMMGFQDLRGEEFYQGCTWRGRRVTALDVRSKKSYIQPVALSGDGWTVLANDWSDGADRAIVSSSHLISAPLPKYKQGDATVTGMSADGRVILGDYLTGRGTMDSIVWIDRRQMAFMDYLHSVSNLDLTGWKISYVRGLSVSNRVFVGDAWYPDGKFGSWILDLGKH